MQSSTKIAPENGLIDSTPAEKGQEIAPKPASQLISH